VFNERTVLPQPSEWLAQDLNRHWKILTEIANLASQVEYVDLNIATFVVTTVFIQCIQKGQIGRRITSRAD
jgi:hypothetical protein